MSGFEYRINKIIKEMFEPFSDEVKIDNYVKVNFTGFEHIVDILGGVEVDIKSNEDC